MGNQSGLHSETHLKIPSHLHPPILNFIESEVVVFGEGRVRGGNVSVLHSLMEEQRRGWGIDQCAVFA